MSEEAQGAISRANIAVSQANNIVEQLSSHGGKVEKFQAERMESLKTSRALKELDRLATKAHGIGRMAHEARDLLKRGGAEQTAFAKLDLAENMLENLLELVNLLEIIGDC